MNQELDLDQTIARIQQWLSYQGPLKDFVCQNPLMAFQNLPFHEGVRNASRMFGSYRLMNLAYYRDAWRDGRVTQCGLDQVLQWHENDSHAREELRRDLFDYPEGSTERPKPISERGVRVCWYKERGVAVGRHAAPVLMRIVANFLDQGVAAWPMPGVELGFYRCIGHLVDQSYKKFRPLNEQASRELLRLEPRDAIKAALKLLVADSSLHERYLLDLLLSLPGWSAMVRQVEKNPNAMLVPRSISVLEYLAVALILDVAVVSSELKDDFRPLNVQATDIDPFPSDEPAVFGRIDLIKTVWHEALEWSLYQQMFRIVGSEPPMDLQKPRIQAAFCLDDRECSIRRYLETVNRSVETFGTAGFFGMDFMYQGHDEWMASQNCPIVLSPKHLVKATEFVGKSSVVRFSRFARLDRSSHTVIRGWLLTHMMGLSAAYAMLRSIFYPKLDATSASSVLKDSDHMPLTLVRSADTVKDRGYHVGYTHEELAERVYGQLKSTGLSKYLAPLIVMVGHGSSTVNNPHYAAYDCGACMGKPGAPNARAFAQAANMPEVRALLAQRGLVIPDATMFVGALHDTTRDEIMYFDLDQLTSAHLELLKEFKISMEQAVALNAKERCRRFELVRPNITPKNALAAVRRRSASIFEPRPELTHTANAFAVVGRRSMTKDVFMDRRAFLNSYDPTDDLDGSILAGLLAAVVPVCGGINLTYLFSRMDNAVMGAGTKLPHNVMGLLGVSNGVEGDLLLGLPKQMVELHEPIRLLLIVEQEPEIALAAVQRNAAIYQWIKNEWVWYGAVSPTTRKIYVLKAEKMIELDLSLMPDLQMKPDSRMCFEGQLGYVPLARLGRKAEGECHA